MRPVMNFEHNINGFAQIALKSTLDTPAEHIVSHISSEPISVDMSSRPQLREDSTTIQAMSSEFAARVSASAAETRESAKKYNASNVRQRDIIDDGEPPKPRAGWSVPQLNISCVIKDLEHAPVSEAQIAPYYSLELHIGDHVYKTPVCTGNADTCSAKFDQLFTAHVDDDLVEVATKAKMDGSETLCLTATCYDCGRRFKSKAVGHVALSISDLLSIQREVWHTMVCGLVDAEGREVIGVDKSPTTLSMILKIDEQTQSLWKPPTLEESLAVCEGPLTLQHQGRKRVVHMSRSLSSSKKKRVSETLSDSSQKNKKTFHGVLFPVAEELLDLRADQDEHDEEDEEEEEIYYWREELERWIDGILIQLLIISLVLLDLTILIIYTLVLSTDTDASLGSAAPSDASQIAVIVTVAILSCFVTELTLRQIAKGARFWRDMWCIFDFVVIWLSILMVVVRQALPAILGGDNQNQLQTANSSTNALRILSRVAQGLRILRVLVNLRHARALSGKMQGKLRGLVSQNRRRFIKFGFDLDATYITNRVIAMSAPSFGRHSTYRNDIHVVSRFLAYMHYGCFFVVNLCDTFHSSDQLIGQYHPGMLFNQVQRIPCEDHCPPLLVEVIRFCEDLSAWMQKDPKNVVAAHCKGGKGRTGLFISAFLLWSGHRRTALDALELFTFRRSDNYDPELGLDSSLTHGLSFKKCNQTVEGPSQIRYVHYVEAVHYGQMDYVSMPKMALKSISFELGPLLQEHPWQLSFTISCMRAPIFDSRNVSTSLIELGGPNVKHLTFECNTTVWGDVRLDFYKHSNKNPQNKRKMAFFIAFHTAFYLGKKSLRFGKKKLDILCKDQKNRRTDENFAVTLDISDERNACEIIQVDSSFQEIMKSKGVMCNFTPGELILQQNEKLGSLILIVSGTVEGVVEELESGPHHAHPLGRCLSSANNASAPERIPNVCLLGPGSVLGGGYFLEHVDSMKFRARTHVQLLKFESEDSKQGTGAQLWRRLRVKVRQSSLADFEIPGLQAADLANFYYGIAVNWATQLSRVQVDVIRIGSLRAFSDRQTVMIDVDENERVRNECILKFSLPMNERLLLKVKCFCRRHGTKGGNLRLILLSNYVIFDPAFYGPMVSASATCYTTHQLATVTPPDPRSSEPKTITLSTFDSFLCGKGALTAAAVPLDITEHKITCDAVSRTRQLYTMLSSMCLEGERVRDRDAIPFLNALAACEIIQFGSEHHLRVGQRVPTASHVDSLFVVRTGEIKLVTRSTGAVFQIIREGQVFGLVDFTLRISPGHYNAIATMAETNVLELPHSDLDKIFVSNKDHCIRFYNAVCCQLEKDISRCLQDAFPGSWSRQHFDPSHSSAKTETTGNLNPTMVLGNSTDSPRRRAVPRKKSVILDS